MVTQTTVDITGIKEFVRKLPPTSVLRDVIMSEPDVMTLAEFASKSSIWLKLSGRELR
jgi:hypothetical protein